MPKGTIGLSLVQRNMAVVGLNENLEVVPWIPQEKSIYLLKMKLEVDFLVRNRDSNLNENFKIKDLINVFHQFNHQCFTLGQALAIDIGGINLVCKVVEVDVVDPETIANAAKQNPAQARRGSRGIFMKATSLAFTKPSESSIKLISEGTETEDVSMETNHIFRTDFSWEKLGIGGLDEELATVFRRAFASRIFPSSLVAKMGIKHVRGMLLYGPPGTGKTLIARQIGQLLNGKEPKIVSGPEILNKFVGQSEENVRLLFKDAEDEYKKKGDDSQLHIIIFDEIDAICKARGSRGDSTGVGDSVVNQLLSKIDGVNSLNNILVIGMTNRKDMIDEALIRPGRLEVQMEIGLPEQDGRLQILRIHTAKMKSSNLLAEDVNLQDIAVRTKNYSGAEIEGLVKCAASFAFERQLDPNQIGKALNVQNVRLTKPDFDRALEEIKPAFGVSGPEFENCIRYGMYRYGPGFDKLVQTCQDFISQVKNSPKTPLLTVLLEGHSGTGKTALAAHMALQSAFPFIKLISPEQFVGFTESAKVSALRTVFENSSKSPLSMIVIDDIERILEYVKIGPRFSNVVLQALMVLLKKPPTKGKKLIVFGTTSSIDFLKDVELSESFDAIMSVPALSSVDELSKVLSQLGLFKSKDIEKIVKSVGGNSQIGIKKLLLLIEMAKQGVDFETDTDAFTNRFMTLLLQHSVSTKESFLHFN
eukprot:TRINITY_DN3489_c0_g1_i1.p1 TRINITY_DN3489_c0_g1~~TRINITY_DN3489_c0_g1_i1.p1  ORF type:complete len:784 (-),score=205.95 TRINITY_DN3489_c0_g1_i1:72-2180(-)